MSVAAARFRFERIRCRLAAALDRGLGRKRTVYVEERTEEYRRYWEEGARLNDAELVPLTEDIWEIRRGDRRVRITKYLTPCDDPATRRLAGDKPYCYSVARSIGIPVPEHIVVAGEELVAAHRFLAETNGPVVVKPARGSSSGLGVSTNVRSRPALIRAAALASLYCPAVIVERMIPGESCRLLFLAGHLIHAVRRGGLPDGRETRELRTVYDETVTALCSPALVSDLAELVRTLGSEFAGIDLICNDLGKPLSESGGTFLEINTTPGIHHHYITPDDFAPNPVAKLVLAYLLGERRRQGVSHGLA
ncbi:MAG TPA: hypothetical protein VGQ69_09545 [Gemmatimonadales bacterium]|nr:hypothetical protein [Gemmatimonadales bacterium]HEV8599590.1 hypothetical protein [Gemmatimonadales bacterium]